MSSDYGKIVVIKRNGSDGAKFPLTATSCLFGRHNDCDIRIQLQSVADEHCRIDVNAQGQIFVTNLSKDNPTLVNGIACKSSCNVVHNDVFTVADRSFRFEFSPGSPFYPKSLKSPVQTPAKLSVKTPTKSPVKIPVKSPVEIPVKTPAKSPVKTPAKSPVKTPAKSPLKTPAKSPAKILTPKAKPPTPASSANKSSPKPLSPRSLNIPIATPNSSKKAGSRRASSASTPQVTPRTVTSRSSSASPTRRSKTPSPPKQKSTTPRRKSPAVKTPPPKSSPKTTVSPKSSKKTPPKVTEDTIIELQKSATPRGTSPKAAKNQSRISASPRIRSPSPKQVTPRGRSSSPKTITPKTKTPSPKPVTPASKTKTPKQVEHRSRSPAAESNIGNLELRTLSPTALPMVKINETTTQRARSPVQKPASPKVSTPQGKTPKSRRSVSPGANTPKTPKNIGTGSGKKRKSTYDNAPPSKRKRVSFGPNLSPEQFDKTLPPSTPVAKGATPRRKSEPLKAITSLSLLKRRSVAAFNTSPIREESPRSTPKSSSSERSPLQSPRGVPKQTPVKSQLSPKTASKSPVPAKSPGQITVSHDVGSPKRDLRESPGKTPCLVDTPTRKSRKDTQKQSTPVKSKIFSAKSPTRTPTRSPTKTPPKSPIRTSGKSPTRTLAKSPTRTPSKSPTRTPAKTPSGTPAKSPTRTPAKSLTRTPAETPSGTSAKSPTRTPAKSPTRTPAKSPTRTPAKSPSGTLAKSPTRTPAKSPIRSPTKSSTSAKSPTRTPVKSPIRTPAKSPAKSPFRTAAKSPAKSPLRTPAKSPAQLELSISSEEKKTPAKVSSKSPAQASVSSPNENSPEYLFASRSKKPVAIVTPQRSRSVSPVIKENTVSKGQDLSIYDFQSGDESGEDLFESPKSKSRQSSVKVTTKMSKKSPKARKSPVISPVAMTKMLRTPNTFYSTKGRSSLSGLQKMMRTPKSANKNTNNLDISFTGLPELINSHGTSPKNSPKSTRKQTSKGSRQSTGSIDYLNPFTNSTSPEVKTTPKSSRKSTGSLKLSPVSSKKVTPSSSRKSTGSVKKSPIKTRPRSAEKKSPNMTLSSRKMRMFASPVDKRASPATDLNKVVVLRAIHGKIATPKLASIVHKRTPKSGRKSVSKKLTPVKSIKKKLWSDILKSGLTDSGIVKRVAAPKPLQAKVVKKTTPKASTFKSKVGKTPKTPRAVARALAPSTGHIESPMTFVVGKKVTKKIKTPVALPRKGRKASLEKSRKSLGNTDYSGLDELFSTPPPKGRKSVGSTDASINQSDTPHNLYADLPDTPNGPGEMIVSPLSSRKPSGRKSLKSPNLVGIKGLFTKTKTPKKVQLDGVEKLMKTPKQKVSKVQKSPELKGLKRLMTTPKDKRQKNISVSPSGVEQLFASPPKGMKKTPEKVTRKKVTPSKVTPLNSATKKTPENVAATKVTPKKITPNKTKQTVKSDRKTSEIKVDTKVTPKKLTPKKSTPVKSIRKTKMAPEKVVATKVTPKKVTPKKTTPARSTRKTRRTPVKVSPKVQKSPVKEAAEDNLPEVISITPTQSPKTSPPKRGVRKTIKTARKLNTPSPKKVRGTRRKVVPEKVNTPVQPTRRGRKRGAEESESPDSKRVKIQTPAKSAVKAKATKPSPNKAQSKPTPIKGKEVEVVDSAPEVIEIESSPEKPVARRGRTTRKPATPKKSTPKKGRNTRGKLAEKEEEVKTTILKKLTPKKKGRTTRGKFSDEESEQVKTPTPKKTTPKQKGRSTRGKVIEGDKVQTPSPKKTTPKKGRSTRGRFVKSKSEDESTTETKDITPQKVTPKKTGKTAKSKPVTKITPKKRGRATRGTHMEESSTDDENTAAKQPTVATPKKATPIKKGRGTRGKVSKKVKTPKKSPEKTMLADSPPKGRGTTGRRITTPVKTATKRKAEETPVQPAKKVKVVAKKQLPSKAKAKQLKSSSTPVKDMEPEKPKKTTSTASPIKAKSPAVLRKTRSGKAKANPIKPKASPTKPKTPAKTKKSASKKRSPVSKVKKTATPAKRTTRSRK